MTYVVYPAILDDSENDKYLYTVTFPNVSGAITEGKTMGQAMVRASEVLGAMLYDVPENQLPVASDVDFVKRQNPNKLVVLIAADLNKAKSEIKPVKVKKNTTIPSILATKAENAGINFSKTLTEALEKKLSEIDKTDS